MTEKQRWLLRELDEWQKKQLHRVGQYGPKKPAKEPREVRAAHHDVRRARAVIERWEASRKLPWQKEKEAVSAKYMAVKRVILFEKTDAALKAIRALK